MRLSEESPQRLRPAAPHHVSPQPCHGGDAFRARGARQSPQEGQSGSRSPQPTPQAQTKQATAQGTRSRGMSPKSPLQ